MNFLVLLLVLWVEKFSALRQRLQRDHFFLAELARLERTAKAHPWSVLGILVLLPVVVLALLLHVLDPVAYGLLALPVHLLVLIYALGRGDAKAALGPLRDAWRRGDEQAAVHVAERDLGLTADDAPGLVRKVQGYLVWQAYQSFFAVIFWYVLLGPAAALAYRLLALVVEHARNQAVQERAGQLRHALDWAPVRMLAASFALVGNFIAVSRALLHELLNWQLPAPHLIETAASAAAELPAQPLTHEQGLPGLDSLWELLLRSAVLWYAGIALWTVLG